MQNRSLWPSPHSESALCWKKSGSGRDVLLHTLSSSAPQLIPVDMVFYRWKEQKAGKLKAVTKEEEKGIVIATTIPPLPQGGWVGEEVESRELLAVLSTRGIKEKKCV